MALAGTVTHNKRHSDEQRGLACLYGIGTATPAHSSSQKDVLRFLVQMLRHQPPSEQTPQLIHIVEQLVLRSGVENRSSVVADFCRDDPSSFEFFPPNWALEPFPSTRARMEVYERESVSLAQEAATRALADAGVSPDRVTHLVVSTCTGFFAPGPDILLIGRLGLRPTVRRTIIGFMGCYAGFNGMRVAEALVRADPEAVVLQVCVELCSLHFQKKPRLDLMISNLLFGDGAAAAVSARAGRPAVSSVCATTLGLHCAVSDDSLSQMAWIIGDHGFEMSLGIKVPETLGRDAPGFVTDLLHMTGSRRSRVCGWAVHPGGPKILRSVRNALQLDADALTVSYSVLRRYGNLSSATIFFVLDDLLRNSPPGDVVALGFGPGLTMEGAVFRKSSR